jgi:hypothetical protein
LRLGNNRRPLGDILGVITDAFQYAGNLQRRHDLTQIIGQRGAQRDDADRQRLGLGFQRIEALVILDDDLRATGRYPRRSS